MYYGDAGTPPPASDHDVAGRLQRFPGRVMVAHADMGHDLMPAWESICYGRPVESEVMLSIRAQYRHRSGRDLLWITTTRSIHGLDPYGRPSEDAPTQIINFLNRTRQGAGHSGRVERGEATVRWLQRIKDEVDQATASEVSVTRDGAHTIGRRITVEGCSVVELPGDNNGRVFCTGTPEAVHGLVLRTAVPTDFPPRYHPIGR